MRPLARLRGEFARAADVTVDNATHTAYVHPGAYAEHLRPETILALTRATPPYVRRASGYF